jgi:hypothetical protein
MEHKESRRLGYGVVRIIRGRHKGTIGYYDDDEGGSAVVYLGTPFASPYVLVRHRSLEPCTEPFPPLEEWLAAHPDLAARVCVHR